VIDRQEYLFECMLRSPSFQEEVSSFFRKYPVFFLFQKKLLHSYGKVEEPVTESWDWFLRGNAVRLKRIEESDESILYKYVFLTNVRPSVELEEWEKKALEFEMELWRAAHHVHGEFPEVHLFSRLEPYVYSSTIPGLPRSANLDYLSLVGCEAEDFEREEGQFAEKWQVFPHHVRPQKEPIVLLRDELERADPSVQLFIPVSEMTTKKELEKRWSEVVTQQEIFYIKKRRPRRTHFEILLKIYDLRCNQSSSVVAKKIRISRSAVEKYYRRVYLDIHGSAPRKAPKSPRAELRGRRKTRLGFDGVAATYRDKESPEQALRSVFLDLNFPPHKLYALETLSRKQKKLLRESLKARTHERQRKGF
jgi:hypothetical protein